MYLSSLASLYNGDSELVLQRLDISLVMQNDKSP